MNLNVEVYKNLASLVLQHVVIDKVLRSVTSQLKVLMGLVIEAITKCNNVHSTCVKPDPVIFVILCLLFSF